MLFTERSWDVRDKLSKRLLQNKNFRVWTALANSQSALFTWKNPCGTATCLSMGKSRADIMFVCSACGTCLARCTARRLLIRLAAKTRAHYSDTRTEQLQTKWAFIKHKPLLHIFFPPPFIKSVIRHNLWTICQSNPHVKQKFSK